jgi:trimeric autotransporter adhesin
MTATAIATVTVTDDRVAGDVLTIGRTAVFSDKNVGTGKTVTVSGAALSGTDSGNYSLSSTTGSTTADITQRTLTISGITGPSRAYNGDHHRHTGHTRRLCTATRSAATA